MSGEPKRDKQSIDAMLFTNRLETLGRLAAGIAQEINTPIQFVSDNAYYIRNSFQDVLLLAHKLLEFCKHCKTGVVDSELLDIIEQLREDVDFDYLESNVPKAIDRTLEGCERLTDIVRAMKAFAHPMQKEKAPTDLNQVLLSTLAIARHEYRSVADVETDLNELPMVLCHASEIGQVFLSLIINAAHAIADKVGTTDNRGVIRVASEHRGSEAEVSIADTGVGIPETIRSRIFETEKVGRGAGRGLLIARMIVVERHGGSIRFESQPGLGATFFIRMPIVGAKPAAQ
jgi:signal transduction histidine kinase